MECTSLEWLEVLQQVGLPVALLLLFVYALYKTLAWFGPRVDKWLTEYFRIAAQKAEVLEASSNRCIQLQEAHLEAVDQLRRVIDDMLRRGGSAQ